MNPVVMRPGDGSSGPEGPSAPGPTDGRDLDRLPSVVAPMSFEELYRVEWPSLLRLGVALTGSVQVAEELVRETFLRFQRGTPRAGIGGRGEYGRRNRVQGCSRHTWQGLTHEGARMDLPGQLDVTVEIEDRRVIVTVRGEVDVSTCGRLHRGLDEAVRLGAPQIAVELTDATFTDSSGLDVLMAAYRDLGRPRALVIRDSSGRRRPLLEVTDPDDLIVHLRAVHAG